MIAVTVRTEGQAVGAGENGDSKTNFRKRLLDAMADSIAAQGYPNTSVADVVRRARTSRRTFYEYFADREACYIALLTDHRDDMARHISAAVDPTAAWHTQVRQAIEAWISFAESRPALMLSWLRDAPSLGEKAQSLQSEGVEAFVVVIQALCNTERMLEAGIGPVSRQRAIMLLGGLRELTAVTVEAGGPLSEITEEALSGSLALLTPRD